MLTGELHHRYYLCGYFNIITLSEDTLQRLNPTMMMMVCYNSGAAVEYDSLGLWSPFYLQRTLVQPDPVSVCVKFREGVGHTK